MLYILRIQITDERYRKYKTCFKIRSGKRNETFSTVNKTPDVVFSIDEDNAGLPTLYITVYFHEDGADVLNLYGEYTSLNKQELAMLEKR